MRLASLVVLLTAFLHCAANASVMPEAYVPLQTESSTAVNTHHMVLPILLELGLRGTLRTWLSMPLKNTTGQPFSLPIVSPIEGLIEALKTAFELGQLNSCEAVEEQLQTMDAAQDFVSRECGNKLKTRSFNNSASYLEVDFDTLCHNNCLPDASIIFESLSNMDDFHNCMTEIKYATPYEIKYRIHQLLLDLPFSLDFARGKDWIQDYLDVTSQTLTFFCTDDGHGEVCGTMLERSIHDTISSGPPYYAPTCNTLHDKLGCCLGELEELLLEGVNQLIDDDDDPVERSDLQCGVLTCSEHDKRMRAAAIAGIVVGSVFLAAALLCGCFCCVRLSRSPRRRQEYIIVGSSTNIYQ